MSSGEEGLWLGWAGVASHQCWGCCKALDIEGFGDAEETVKLCVCMGDDEKPGMS